MFYLLIIQVCIGIILCFQNVIKKNPIRSFKLFKTTTCFPGEDDQNKYTNILLDNAQFEYESIDNHEKPLYTLIWYDCKESKEILKYMKDLNLKYIFINLNNLIMDSENNYLFPLLYKDEECIGDNLFDIYKEISL
jgi:hypothetical protein